MLHKVSQKILPKKEFYKMEKFYLRTNNKKLKKLS